MNPLIRVVIAILVLCASPYVSYAQKQILVKMDAVVRSEPNSKSEALLTLKKGQSVKVVGERPGWKQVEIIVDKSFKFNGWVLSSAVDEVAGKVAKPAPRPTVKSPPPKKYEPPKKKEPLVVKDDTEGSFLSDRLAFSIGPGVAFYKYSLSSAGTAGNVVDSKIFGAGVDAEMSIWFWHSESKSWRAGALLNGQYVMYFHKTNVNDSSGNLVSTQSKNSKSYSFWPKALFGYQGATGRFEKSANVALGFQYFQFKGDDVDGGSGPLNLFVSQRTMAPTVGLSGSFPVMPAVGLTVSGGVDVLPFSFVSEDPSDITGTDPKGKFGFIPNLTIHWYFTEHQALDLGYQLRMQNYDYSGTGSRVGTSNVTDGSAKTMLHLGTVRYEYRF